MSKIFVTGATGVLGRRAVPLLVAAGHDVTAVARSAEKASTLADQGATPTECDLFDAESVRAAVAGHDVIAHLATNIPTGSSAMRKRGWRNNDRLRSDAAGNLAAAAVELGIGRYVQESITFPYVDGGDVWVDEQTDRTYFWGNRTTVDAEAAAGSVTDAEGAGVVLRFASFMATDSAHMQTYAQMAGKGMWGLFGSDEGYTSFIDADDAAAAVVAAVDAPAGVYNIAESEPLRRSDHRAALAAAVGRSGLRTLPLVERMAGEAGESLARSHRISNDAFRSVTSWQPTVAAVDMWSRFR
jgi:nucleoside-diphosphate-sugar epimerase